MSYRSPASAGHMKKSFLIICAIVVLFLALSCKKQEGQAPKESTVLDFTLADIQGTKVTLSGLKGKVVLVEFWATWCPPCRDSVPEMNKLYEKFRGRNFELLAIAIDGSSNIRSDVGSFIKENGIAYRVLIDDDKASSVFGVINIPVVFLIDKNGNIVKKHTGFMPGLSEELSNEIEVLL